MSIINYQNKSDLFGSLASTMCMVHCMATPIIFLVQTNHSNCGTLGPWWWHAIDYLFLVIGIIAIYQTTKNTSIHWMPAAMYTSWVLLSLFIVNAKTSLFPIPGIMLNVPACSLVALHLYNLRHCQCVNDECCIK